MHGFWGASWQVQHFGSFFLYLKNSPGIKKHVRFNLLCWDTQNACHMLPTTPLTAWVVAWPTAWLGPGWPFGRCLSESDLEYQDSKCERTFHLVVNALPSECLTQKKKYNSIGILFSQAHQYFVMYHSNSHERSAFKHPFFCCQVFFGSSNNQELHLHPMQVKGTFRPLGSSSKLLIPERFWIEATLGTRHFDCLCMKIWCFKGQLKSFNFQCLEFQSNFNTVQLCSTIQLINLHNMFFNQLVQCTISLLLSTRTQLHQQDAIVSPCGLQNHSRWIPVGDSIEIELPNLWHNEINKLQVIWVYQRNLEDWWRFFGDLSGAKRVSMIPNKLRVLFCPVGAVQA